LQFVKSGHEEKAMTNKQFGSYWAQHDHQVCISEAIRNAERLCHRQQQRLTTVRKRVLELVWEQHKPIGAYDVLEILQQEAKATPPTVYRALDFLQGMGLVHRISSLNAYVGCSFPGHPHDGQFLICQSCQSLAEIDAPEINHAILESAAQKGFEPRKKTIEIMGLCPECSE
jgi:Fur family zinc uptake transcriptional regulator